MARKSQDRAIKCGTYFTHETKRIWEQMQALYSASWTKLMIIFYYCNIVALTIIFLIFTDIL